MPPPLTHLRARRIVSSGRVGAGVIHIQGEKIARIEWGVSDPSPKPAHPAQLIDAGDLAVLPGLVDTHVHVNEPGRTDWEGFETAGRAAAAGGITTIVVMPLNCTPAATNQRALLAEANAAAGKCLIDFGLWGGLVSGNTADLESMWNAGALGFKCFMTESGVDDFAAVSSDDLRLAAPVLARLRAPLLAHAEDADCLARAAASHTPLHRYADYARTRPDLCEMIAVRTLWLLAGEYPTWPIHIVHITSPSPATFLEPSNLASRTMTGETCPHYLTFCAEEIPDGATQFKCAPPIRDRATREQLWELLGAGTLTMVVSDHSPCPPAMKHLAEGDFAKAWGGISSLQLGLSATWTGASRRNFTLADVARWMCENPAKLAGIQNRKGRIAPGNDADLILFDPDTAWTVRADALHHRHKLTPYDGLTLRGVVKRTILRGRTVYDAEAPNPFPLEPIGQWTKRDT